MRKDVLHATLDGYGRTGCDHLRHTLPGRAPSHVGLNAVMVYTVPRLEDLAERIGRVRG